MNRVIREHAVPGGAMIRLVQGDITEERVDAIVNAANERLQHGGGVAGAIVRKGGKVIQQESDAIGRVPTGGAAITGAGSLPSRHVIHAVGPIWGSGDEDRKLESAVRSSLQVASEHSLRSVSLPAISSGIYGFPKDECAEILLNTAVEYLEAHRESSLKEVRFCLYNAATVEAFQKAWEGRYGDQA